MTAAVLPARRAMGTFYVWMGGLFVLIAFAGFAQSYWLQLAPGSFTGSPLLHLHGLLFTAWTLFFLSQASLAASGRMQHHRAWGVFGVALATAMVCVGLATAIASMAKQTAAGHGDLARAFFIVPFVSLVLFAGLVGWSVAKVKTPEVHKRLMTLATMAILQAPLARFFFMANVPGGPGIRTGTFPPPPVVTAIAPALVVMLLVLIAIAYDWRARGRPHPAYLLGGGVVVLAQLACAPLSATGPWQAVAAYFATFAHYT